MRDLTRPDKVWAQLAELFGNAFYREYSESPPRLWQEAIWKLTDKQIVTGLTNLAEDGLHFPANLSQFVEACNRKPKQDITVPYWDKPKQVEDQRPKGRMSFAEWKAKNEGK